MEFFLRKVKHGFEHDSFVAQKQSFAWVLQNSSYENVCSMYMKTTVPEPFLINFQPVSLQCYLKVSSTGICSIF